MSPGGVALPRLLLVTDRRRTRGREMIPLIAEAVLGGVGIVQVREKDLGSADLEDLLAAIRSAVGDGVRVVLNGEPALARSAGVGLHLPAAAPAVRPDARTSGGLISRSAHDAAEAQRAAEEGVDYLILGTVYPTASKPGHLGAGVEHVAEITRQVAPLPVFAIGGVTTSRIPELVHAGAHGVAVCGAILSSNHPRRVAEAMSLALRVSSAS